MHPLQHLSTGDCVGSLAELNLSSCIHITDQGLDLLLAASPPRLAILVVHRSVLTIGCSYSINTNTAATVHSIPECGFKVLKTYQAPAHI